MPVGGFEGAAGLGGIGELPDFLDAFVRPFLDIEFDPVDRESEAAADGSIEILGINGMFEEGYFGNALQMVEVGDIAGGDFAEERGIGEDRGTFGKQMGFQGLTEDGGPERTATRTAGVG